jgi:superfamily II DNA or RNA helicase
VFPHDSQIVGSTFGYHPLHEDLSQVAGLATVGRILILGPDVPDIASETRGTRYLPTPQVQLPRGIYWFASQGVVDLLVVTEGAPSAPGEFLDRSLLSDTHALVNAAAWHDSLWNDALEVVPPSFDVGDEVIVVASGQDSVVRRRGFTSGSWLYEIRLEGRLQNLAENQLAPFPDDDDPLMWIAGPPAPVPRFAATLTRAKLEGSFTDTVFSFRATRTLFRPYQFKPVIKLLQTGKSRLLIADEVGLGKTIEAGLIWTELEARRSADRVLIVCPSNLVAKWRSEMDERFNFSLQELDGRAMADFEERARTGRLPRRGAYIGSLERLRRWEALEELTGVIPQFDLVVFDEAHQLRNVGNRSNAFGAVMSELADTMVFLSATPLNLRSEDLFNLLDLLSPGEFGDALALDEQLEPNAVLHQVTETLAHPDWTTQRRLALLDTVDDSVFGRLLDQRPEMEFLREILAVEPLTAGEIVRAKRYLADLNALSAVVTRTRKVEVDESKAIREPRLLEVAWSPAESHFYREYYKWCRARADAAGTPIGFAMQMPLRLASACLPAAGRAVLEWTPLDFDPIDEDSEPSRKTASALVAPHPELVKAAGELKGIDTKLEALVPNIKDLVEAGRQCLLFTFSRPTLEYLSQHLSGIARVAVLHGGVSKDARQRILSDFRQGAYDVVLANRVASEGLDFEFCSVVINYDLPWNPMEVEQRIGRIDRIGQVAEKVIVVNFYNDETIDQRILLKVLERIGVFERSIGALEPIIQSTLTDLEQTFFDFSLSDEQREAKALQVLEAVEAQSAGIEDLSSAASFLLVSNDVDVSGMEEELLRTGRYVGQTELTHLLDDWCQTAGAPGVKVAKNGRTMTLRGNDAMAQQLQGLVSRGHRSSLETQEFISMLQSELEINLILDQEVARTGGGNLLTATHPLVLTALSVPGFQNSRFSTIRVTSSESGPPAGRYLVQLGVAQWTGVRPGREIWGAAVSSDGQEAPAGVVDALLSQLASGGLMTGGSATSSLSTAENLMRTTQLLGRRQISEAALRERESAALLASRRTSLTILHERKIQAIGSRIETASQRERSRVIPLFHAQRRRAEDKFRQTMTELELGKLPWLKFQPLAVCELEIGRG